MKDKDRTIEIRRAREAKTWRNYYFGTYLPVEEPFGILMDSSEERLVV